MKQKNLFEIKKFYGKPSSLLFTDRNKITNLPRIIENLPKNSAIIVREYDFDCSQREIFTQEIRQLVQRKLPSRRPKIFVGKNWRLAKKMQADGVHFSDHDRRFSPQKLTHFLRKKFPKNFLISYAAHSSKSALCASRAKLDLIVISPIFCHKSKPLGARNFAKISSKFKSRAYALGGVNERNLKSVRKLEIAGFGAINFFEKNL